MELDQLKTAWKEVVVAPGNTSQAELEQLLHARSRSPIAKLKRNLLWELAFVIVIYGATIVYYFLNLHGGMLLLAWLLIVLGALYVWYYATKRRLLNKMECVSCEVKSNLSMQLVSLEKMVKLYLWAGTLLFPFVVMASLLIGLVYDPGIDQTQITSPFKFYALFMGVGLIVSAVLTIPIYFLNKWYVHKLYGQHVKKLRQLVNEMNEYPFEEKK